MVRDPVCGMTVNQETAKFRTEYMGATHYFCSQSCKANLDRNPGRYVGEQGGHKEYHSCC